MKGLGDPTSADIGDIGGVAYIAGPERSSDPSEEIPVAYNTNALAAALARRIELDAIARHARAANMTREQLQSWLRDKRVKTLTTLPDGQREELLDELRRGVDRRWQYGENMYGVALPVATQLNKCALRLGPLNEMADQLRISTPRLFCVLPSRTALKLDSITRWLEPERWNAGSFALHLMCEWDGGHFLPSRYAYPLPDPQTALRDCGSILHYCLELLQDALAALEESPSVLSSSFIVPMAKLRKESAEAASNHGGAVQPPRPTREADAGRRGNPPFLFDFMSRVLERAKKRALSGSAAASQAADVASNYGVSLCHLERFVLSCDPLGAFGGLYCCEPPPLTGAGAHPDRPLAAPPHKCWLCPQHAKEISAVGGSVSLGRTPPWSVSGLLYLLANQPYIAPTQPFGPPGLLEMTMVTPEPPAAGAPMAGATICQSDRAAAKRKLKKLPVPLAAAAAASSSSEQLPTVLRADAASVLKGLGDPKSSAKPVSSAGQPGPSSACAVQ